MATSHFVGSIIGVGVAILASNYQHDRNYISIPKEGVVKEALAQGVSEQQLKAAFEEATPEIVNNAAKEQYIICKISRDMFGDNGGDCAKILAAYHPKLG